MMDETPQQGRSLAGAMGLTRVVLIVSAAASILIGTWLLGSRADEVARQRVTDAERDIARTIAERAEVGRLQAENLAQAPALRTALASDLDRETIEDVVASLLGTQSIEMVRIADRGGRVFAMRPAAEPWSAVPSQPGWTMHAVGGKPTLIVTAALELRPGYVVHVGIGRTFEPPADDSRSWWFGNAPAAAARPCKDVDGADGILGHEDVYCTTTIVTPEGQAAWAMRIDARSEWLHAISVLAGSGAVILIGTLAVLWLLQVIGKRDRELTRAKEAAEAATRAKGEFLAMMSHEIRTPMNAVIGMADLLQRTAINSRQMQYLSTLRGSANALLGVINDILDISKIEAGKLELRPTDLDLRDVVEEVCATHASQAHAKRLELVCDVPARTPTLVRVDGDRLRQILTNLIGNAIKFTESGEITVRMTATVKEPQVTLTFSVEDTGIGISKEDQAKLFSPFWQADSSHTRKKGGTGLGLAIASRLAMLMGSELKVETALGRGTKFWFSVVAQRAMTGRVQRVTGRLHRLKLLVVDDNATNRLIVQQQLQAWGMAVSSVESGAAAIAAIAAARDSGNPFEVVLMDGHMPHMPGLDVATKLRKNGERDLRIVMLTSVDADTDKAARAQVDDWLTKPVRQAQLYECLVKLCSPRESVWDSPSMVAAVRRSTRVLLVEDNEVNQAVATDMLKELGIVPKVVGDGAKAVERVRAERFDLVLMDCQMPIMDGYEATAEIRHIEGNSRRTPIVALTAHAMVGDREAALAAGMDDYLVKPITIDALSAMIEKWAERRVRKKSTMQPPTKTSTPVPPRAELLGPSRARTPKVVELFFELAPKEVENIRKAGDATTLRKEAHKLKGSAFALALPRLAATLSELEKHGANGGEPSAAAGLLAQLVEDFEATRLALADELTPPLEPPPPLSESARDDRGA